jgi:hypothetical protein
MVFLRRLDSAVKSCAVSFSLDQNCNLKRTFFPSCKKKVGKYNWEFFSGLYKFCNLPRYPESHLRQNFRSHLHHTSDNKRFAQ